uniref:Uncharacterized protein n=1 Tax=Anopheles coluzzii TaxID=1518534 RepID=A0A6E8VGB0_ANOCL
MKYVFVALMLVALVFAIVVAQGIPIPSSSEVKLNLAKRSISQHRAAFTSYFAHDESDSISPEDD